MLYIVICVIVYISFFRGDLMNIRDIGNTANSPESSRFDAENVNIDHPIERGAHEVIPERQDHTDEHHDEYVRSLTNNVKSTLYEVNNVRMSRIRQIRSQIREEKYDPSGEKIAEKVVDILLPLGMKTLSVYKYKKL